MKMQGVKNRNAQQSVIYIHPLGRFVVVETSGTNLFGEKYRTREAVMTPQQDARGMLSEADWTFAEQVHKKAYTKVSDEEVREICKMLKRMRQQGNHEGSVSLKISVSLERQFPLDENGKQHEIYVPKFEHETAAQIVQKQKTSGEIKEDFVLTIGHDGLPKMYSRDTDNLFDMVEREAGKNGKPEQGAAD